MWWIKVLIFLTVVFVKSIKSEISCINESGDGVYFCSDAASSGGQEIQNLCPQVNPNYITIEAKNTTIINKSILYRCNPSQFTLINGSLQDISPQTFVNFRDLKQLDLSGNKIKELLNGAFFFNSENSQCKILIDLSKNQINTIEDGAFGFDRGTNQFKINLSHNKLEDFNLSSIASGDFYYVDLSFNKIERIRGTGSKFFKASLQFAHNQLKTVDFSVFNISQIVHLGLSFNNLTNLICDGKINTTIDKLDLTHNQLTKINFTCLKWNKYFTQMDLSFNNISEIVINPSNEPVVENLILNQNSLMTLPKFALPIVKGLLDLSCNKLESIHVKTFFHLHDLQILNLSNNHLENLQFGVFHNLDKLEILDLSNNRLILKDLQTVYGLNSLITFYLHNNQIKQIDVNNLPNSIKELSLYGNQFEYSCLELHELIEQADFYNIRIIKGPQVDVEHVHGMACRSSYEENKQESVTSGNEPAYLIKNNTNDLKEISRILVNLTKNNELLNLNLEQKINTISIQLTLLLMMIFFIFLIIVILWKSNNLKKYFFNKNRNQSQEEHSSQNLIISTNQELIEM